MAHMHERFSVLIFSLILFYASTQCQNKHTAEDSLHYSLFASPSTTIGGYGNAIYQHNTNLNLSSADVERVVLFVGHNFTGVILFFSELEMEDAKVNGGEDGGEIAFEQAYLKFNLDQNHYVSAGLFLPRIGILNENHLPTSFNGNERTQVETNILPSTWREIGVGFYGTLQSAPVNYSFAILNGLNSASFEHGSGIREGRYEGRNANTNSLAITGAVQWNQNNITTQVSGYYGGTTGNQSQQPDSLNLPSGIFGLPVAIGEADIQYESDGFSIRALGTIVAIPKAEDINRVYGNNTPLHEYGVYIEAGYDVFQNIAEMKGHRLIPFIRYERLDMNASVPSNGIIDGTLDQHHIVTGFSYFPINDVVIKADVRLQSTGDQNPVLATNPDLQNQPYRQNDTFYTLGIGLSF
jgi:hypothetical protein